MMIVRIKTVADARVQEKVRERIKKQMKEGLIVHDDTIEITFADSMCTQCGSTDLEEIKAHNGDGVILGYLRTCNGCGNKKDLLK